MLINLLNNYTIATGPFPVSGSPYRLMATLVCIFFRLDLMVEKRFVFCSFVLTKPRLFEKYNFVITSE